MNPLPADSDPLAQMGSAMRHPVQGAQQVFRTLLDAFAAPGRVHTLPAACLEDIEPPVDTRGHALPAALAAVLLTLLDRETQVRLHGPLASDALAQYLRFHTGVRQAAPAAFEVMTASELRPALLDGLARGSDEHPQLGATVVVQTEGFDSGPALQLEGPGIASRRTLRVAGVATVAWAWRRQSQTEYPRGLDLVFVCGAQLVALPRSTRIVEIG